MLMNQDRQRAKVNAQQGFNPFLNKIKQMRHQRDKDLQIQEDMKDPEFEKLKLLKS